jgi:L-iditol 2-dehydrogenase
MRGVAFLGDHKLQQVQFPDPAPGPHDVVVEIKASGMCGRLSAVSGRACGR